MKTVSKEAKELEAAGIIKKYVVENPQSILKTGHYEYETVQTTTLPEISSHSEQQFLKKEIEARAMDKDNCWVYGEIHLTTSKRPHIHRFSGKEVEIYPYTVGLYSRAKDSKGDKIYEGDLVSIEYADRASVKIWKIKFGSKFIELKYDTGRENKVTEQGEIVFENGSFLFKNTSLFNGYTIDLHRLFSLPSFSIKVRGNIHDRQMLSRLRISGYRNSKK
jgi:hypothetical protein